MEDLAGLNFSVFELLLLLLLSRFSRVRCPTLCNPRDSSPPGSAVPGILQARMLEWVASERFKLVLSMVVYLFVCFLVLFCVLISLFIFYLWLPCVGAEDISV